MLKSIQCIVDGSNKLEDLDAQGLSYLIQDSIASGDFRALRLVTNIHTGIYNYNERKPWWLLSNFDDNVWLLDFTDSNKKAQRKTKLKFKKLDWSTVYLDDGKPLTDIKHKKLLNSFKYWITAVDNPLENGGKVVKAGTARTRLMRVVSLINAILLHAKTLSLAQFQLQNVNDDFWLNVLVQMATYGGIRGIYEPELRIKQLLDTVSESITDAQVAKFIQDYPYLSQTLVNDDITLSLNNRAKACAWLFEQGFYKNSKGFSKYQVDKKALTLLLFDGKVLSYDFSLSMYPELHLKAPSITTEYPAVETCNRSVGLTSNHISSYIASIRLIQTKVPSAYLTAGSIQAIVKLKKNGRSRTLPPEFVFNLMSQCYEFVMEHLPTGDALRKIEPSLLSETLNLLDEGRGKSTKGRSNSQKPRENQKVFNKSLHGNLPTSERGHWFQFEAINGLSANYINKGIKQINTFDINVPYRHKKIRANESLFDLFNVLQGAIQVLVGAIMARRQDELIQLKSHGNLSPNVSPFSPKGIASNYSLKFKVKKSGVGGINSINETIERPIPLSIAKFIWQLEQFNIEASERGLNKGNLSLFNNLESRTCQLSCLNYERFNVHLDAVCDYFETDLVQYDSDEYRRNYVRQHQLRRFFAMAFFWSKGFDGMDSLRWMLAHSDMEHLYHYISESEPGAVLAGAKATIIKRGLLNSSSELSKLEGIDEIRKTIAKRVLGDETKAVEISTLSDASEYYEDESYLTVPHINQIKKEQEIENEIINMLEVGEITLEPEFFTIKDPNGDNVRTFNLILKIKDLD